MGKIFRRTLHEGSNLFLSQARKGFSGQKGRDSSQKVRVLGCVSCIMSQEDIRQSFSPTDGCVDYMNRVAFDPMARVGLRKMASTRVEMAMLVSGQARLWMLLQSFIHFSMAQSQTMNFYVPQTGTEIASRTSRHERTTNGKKGCLHDNIYV